MSESTNTHGRSYHRGKALSCDVRQLVITSLLENGAKKETAEVPRGIFAQFSRQYKITKPAVKSVWNKFCEDGNYDSRSKKGAGGGRPRKLSNGDLEFIEISKKQKPTDFIS